MPHDKNGNLLKEGDEVILRCKVISVYESETQCNVLVEAAERPDGEGYIPQITGNSRFYEKHEDVVITPDNDGAIIENKGLRKELDEIIQQAKGSHRKSRERSIVITKLQEAVMWLGMDLKELGTPNPYPNSRDTSNTKVDPTADGLKL